MHNTRSVKNLIKAAQYPIAEQHELIKGKTLPKQKTIIYVIFYQI